MIIINWAILIWIISKLSWNPTNWFRKTLLRIQVYIRIRTCPLYSCRTRDFHTYFPGTRRSRHCNCDLGIQGSRCSWNRSPSLYTKLNVRSFLACSRLCLLKRGAWGNISYTSWYWVSQMVFWFFSKWLNINDLKSMYVLFIHYLYFYTSRNEYFL